MTVPTQYINVDRFLPLISPAALRALLPAPASTLEAVVRHRHHVTDIIQGVDSRKLIAVGPCSIHDVAAALDYAKRLATLAQAVKDRLVVVMRVYFEKPRTTVGWKGLINDPYLSGQSNMEAGLKIARQLLLDIGEIGLPVATELLDPIVPQYISDLVSWASIGARTTESQTHREMASGLSMPVGFKNGTDGNLDIAIHAMEASKTPHQFLGINPDGQTSVVVTKGNPVSHVVLRGSRHSTNYDQISVIDAVNAMEKAGFNPAVMVDCSHGNSRKKYENQEAVFSDVLSQIMAGQKGIIGWMLESNIHPGNQPLTEDLSQLEYGLSVTDPCMGWETTESLIREAYSTLSAQ